MPHLTFRGVEKEMVQKASEALPDSFARIVGCPPEYFTFFHETGRYFVRGQEPGCFPVVQIHWFDRGQIIKNMFAAHLTDFMKANGCDSVEVFFVNLEKNSYYEDGKHF